MFYGQHGEDGFIRTLFPDGYIGTCVDVGAYDGVCSSNTYYFEQQGWKCLCIEPNQQALAKCMSLRKEVVRCCVSDRDKEDQEFTVFYLEGENMSAISSLQPDDRLIQSHSHLIKKTEKQWVPVRSLTSLLDEYQYPKEIDFISIDTENTELDVLRGLDLDKYRVKLLVVENNFQEPKCEDYLKAYGYTKVHRMGVNDFFLKTY